MLGAGVCFSTVLTAYRYTAGMRGIGDIRDQVDDDGEVERREELKKVRRRPMSETLQQLGEGRGMSNQGQDILAEADFTRNLRSRIRGEEAATTVGKVRRRRQGSARSRLEALHISLESQRKHHTNLGHIWLVYIPQTIEDFIKTLLRPQDQCMASALSHLSLLQRHRIFVSTIR